MKTTCKHCGVTFDAGRKTAKFCSVPCKAADQKGCVPWNKGLTGTPGKPKTNTVATCQHCGKEFYRCKSHSNRGGKFCSMTCYLTNRWNGIDGPKTCGVCGREYTSGKRSQRYCCRACAEVAKIGRANPRENGRESRTCFFCGKEFSRCKANFHSETAFCSAECQGRWRSITIVGEAHPRWRGGGSNRKAYGPGWNAARKEALRRAKHKCAKCGRKACEVHHKLPVRFFDKPEDAHFQGNLIVLCDHCHPKEEAKVRHEMPLLDQLQHSPKVETC